MQQTILIKVSGRTLARRTAIRRPAISAAAVSNILTVAGCVLAAVCYFSAMTDDTVTAALTALPAMAALLTAAMMPTDRKSRKGGEL